MISAVIEICTGNPKEEATRIFWEIRVGFTEIRHLIQSPKLFYWQEGPGPDGEGGILGIGGSI